MDIISEFKERVEEGKYTEQELLELALEYKEKVEEYKMTNGKKYSQNTLNQRYSEINKIIKEKYPNYYQSIMTHIRPSREIKRDQIIESLKKNISRLNDDNKIKVDVNEIKEAVEILTASDKFYDLCVLALIVSGRRSSELFKSEFTPSNKPHHINFKNPLKKRSQDKDKVFEIPILFIKPDEFLRIIQSIRNQKPEYKDYDKKKVANLTNPAINKNIKIIFNNKIMKTETLRAIYAHLTFLEYAPKNVSEINWINRVLCHIETDFLTDYFSYSYVIESDKFNKVNKSKKGEIKEKINHAVEQALQGLGCNKNKKQKPKKYRQTTIDEFLKSKSR